MTLGGHVPNRIERLGQFMLFCGKHIDRRKQSTYIKTTTISRHAVNNFFGVSSVDFDSQ